MINISSLEGRIGEFWWINAQPSSWIAGESILPGSKRRFAFWGGCGYGRVIRVRLKPLPEEEVEP